MRRLPGSARFYIAAQGGVPDMPLAKEKRRCRRLPALDLFAKHTRRSLRWHYPNQVRGSGILSYLSRISGSPCTCAILLLRRLIFTFIIVCAYDRISDQSGMMLSPRLHSIYVFMICTDPSMPARLVLMSRSYESRAPHFVSV
jgi:hypothetical protein